MKLKIFFIIFFALIGFYKVARAENFVPLNQTVRNWYDIAIDSSNHDVFAISWATNEIYKQTGGVGNFVGLGQNAKPWNRLDVNSITHDIYATTIIDPGDIYKQTGGIGDFVALGQALRSWHGIAVDPTNNNVYATVNGDDIYKQTGGIGDFVALGQGSANWESIAIDSSNHNVYVVLSTTGDIYKQTGGIGDFVALGQIPRDYYGIDVDSVNHNVYAAVYNGDIYKQTGGTGDFVALGQTPRNWFSIAVDSSNKNVYAIEFSGDIYKSTSNNCDPSSSGQIATGAGAEIGLIWGGCSGATAYKIYRAIDYGSGVGDPVLIATLPALNSFPNPYSAVLPDDAKKNRAWSAGSSLFYSWDDMTASSIGFNYYWVQSVGTGSGARIPLNPIGVKKSINSSLPLRFQANGSAGIVNIANGGQAVLTWKPEPGFASCTASGDWSGTAPLRYVLIGPNNQVRRYGQSNFSTDGDGVDGTQTFTNITSNKTYTLTCTVPTDIDGVFRTNAETLWVNVSASPATVSISADSTNIPYNTATTLRWTYTNATAGSCAITPPGTVGGYPAGNGSVSTGNLTTPRTYTINCQPAGANSTASVVVQVQPAPQYSLNLTKFGFGTVSSDPSGVSCGSSCSRQSVNFDSGTVVNLTIMPLANRIFTGWGGDCISFGINTTCRLTIDGVKNVNATFSPAPKFREF